MKDDMKIEMEAGRNIQLDHIKEVLAKNDMVRQNEEMVKMITKLREQNTRLQSELNKAIHQLKDYENALKKYADEKNWNEDLGGNYNFHYKEKYQPKTFEGFLECVFDYHIAPTIYNGLSLAQETLEKWEDK